MNFDPAAARTIYDSAVQNGYQQGLHVGWHRGYTAGQQAQALTDEQLIEALAWAQQDLRILEENRIASIRGTIAGLQAQGARARMQAQAATRPDSRPRRTAA